MAKKTKPAKPTKAQKDQVAQSSAKEAKPAKAVAEETENAHQLRGRLPGPAVPRPPRQAHRARRQRSERDVIRHNGSVVILAVDNSKSKKDPWIVMERQYRHAAKQYLWELPAGKLDPGEDPLAGAQRELEEETGYRAKKWKPLVEYYGSPGFLGESMKVFLAEGLVAGDAHPEDDEDIEFRLVKLSEILEMIEKGAHQGRQNPLQRSALCAPSREETQESKES